MSRTATATGMALGVTLVLSAPALAGVTGPGTGEDVGNSNAESGQQNCLGEVLSSFAEGEGLHIGQEEGATGAEVVLPFIGFVRDAAETEGECDQILLP